MSKEFLERCSDESAMASGNNVVRRTADSVAAIALLRDWLCILRIIVFIRLFVFSLIVFGHGANIAGECFKCMPLQLRLRKVAGRRWNGVAEGLVVKANALKVLFQEEINSSEKVPACSFAEEAVAFVLFDDQLEFLVMFLEGFGQFASLSNIHARIPSAVSQQNRRLNTVNEVVPIVHTKKQDQVWFYGSVFLAPALVLGLGALVNGRRRGRVRKEKQS